jgi:hypothetical protein
VQPPHEPVRIIVQRTPLRAPSNKPSRNSTPWSIGTAEATRGRDRNAKQPEMDDVDGIERRKAKPLPALQYLLRFAPSSRFAWLLSFVYFPTPPPLRRRRIGLAPPPPPPAACVRTRALPRTAMAAAAVSSSSSSTALSTNPR